MRPTVVIVDDSEYLAQQIAEFFQAHDFEVLGIGHDGFQGFKLYKQFQPHLITLDLTMPNKDGRECLQDILSYDPQACVLVISALVDKSIILNCLEMGASGFQEKPLRFRQKEFCDEFLKTIKIALKKA
jgi:two-component system, chemotaxis family, chemotaxis protein CheY